MTGREVVVAVLVGLGVTVEILCAVGVLVMRNPFARLHYLGPASTLGPLLLAVAVLVDQSPAEARIKAVLIALVLLVIGPVVTHATAQAAWVRQQNRLDVQDGEERGETT